MNKQVTLPGYYTILIAITVSCVACQNNTTQPEPKSNQADSAITIDNCGFVGQYQSAPDKVVSIGQHTTEILIALGLKDKIVGWCFPDNNPLPQLPVLADNYPSKEVFLEKMPDFIYSGYVGTFESSRLGSRASLLGLHINSYIPVSRCIDTTRAATITDVFTDIINIGNIFRVQDKADSLVTALKGKLAAFKKDNSQAYTPGVLIFGGPSSEGVIAVSGGYDLSSQLVAAAGGRNIFSDIPKQSIETSIEEVIIRNPDIIVVKESIRDPGAARSIAFLKANTSLSVVNAVKQQHYVVVPYTALLPGIRIVDAIDSMYKKFLLPVK